MSIIFTTIFGSSKIHTSLSFIFLHKASFKLELEYTKSPQDTQQTLHPSQLYPFFSPRSSWLGHAREDLSSASGGHTSESHPGAAPFHVPGFCLLSCHGRLA